MQSQPIVKKLQSFLKEHQIEQKVHQNQRYVEDLKDDDRAKEFEIKLKQNDEIDKALSKLETLESLGELVLVKTERAMNIEPNVRKEAQAESQEQSNINNITIYIETKIEINIKKVISDMICLMDGRVIVVEKFGKVNLFTSDGKRQKQLTIFSDVCSVARINQDTIVLTYYNEKAIKMFNMEKEKVTKVITLHKVCWVLSFSNNSLALGLYKNEIRIIDKFLLDFFIHCNDRVIYSDCKGKAIYCVDESGKQIWQYRQDLSFPRGLCTDSYGNIFVADHESNRIIVISKDGQDSKVLISKEVGLKNPWCICFKHNESSGFICDYFGIYLVKFNISSG